jgi:gamma-glutamyltranspeptidase/glutathione hydrolase
MIRSCFRHPVRRPLLALAAVLALGTTPLQAWAQQGTGGDIVGYGQIHHPEIGRGGMVVAQNRIAANVGAEILRKGGNAVDAAVATAFAEAVSLPRAGNLGGGGYMLIHIAKTNETVAIEYYGQAPLATTPDLLLGPDGKARAKLSQSFKGVSVPGTVAGLWEAHHRYGKLPWKAVVAPAVQMAKTGVILSDDEAFALNSERKAMITDPGAAKAFYKKDGSAYQPGERLPQPDLAWSLAQIRDHGVDAFYKGEVGKRMVAGIKAGGGVISMEDLATYKANVSAPIWGEYRGHKIAYMPPTASGVTLAEVMNILETFPMKDLGSNSVASLHVLSEAMKIGWTDRQYVGGPPQWTTPVNGLTSKAYAAERAKLISMTASLSSKDLKGGDPYRYESPNTTHFSVADAEGNAVSNTFTLSASFGAHVVAPGTGFLLNNSMGNFAWGARGETDKANKPEPGKRVSSTITPLIVFKGDKPWLVTGTPGGGYIIATMAQMLSNVIDHDLNVAEAAERPRMNQSGVDGPLELEAGFSPDIVPLLEAKGHKVAPSMTMGSTQSILIDGGLFYGAADTRRPDAAVVGAR